MSWYERLEAGTFQFPFAVAGRREIAAWELGVLLEGIDRSEGRRRKRYALPAALAETQAERASAPRRLNCYLLDLRLVLPDLDGALQRVQIRLVAGPYGELRPPILERFLAGQQPPAGDPAGRCGFAWGSVPPQAGRTILRAVARAARSNAKQPQSAILS